MVLHMLSYEWKRTLKRPTLFLFVILFPIIVLVITGLIIYSYAKEEVDQIEILVLDEDATFETTTLMDQLINDETINEHVQFISGYESIDYYLNGQVQYAAIVHVPKGFTDDLRSGINREIDVYLNENVAISSGLAHMLLESGQNYISAAQSGVNTVNQLYIKSLDDANERRSFVQQMTIHFTLLTLGRNSFFELDESLENEMLNWFQQLYIIVVTALFFLTYLLFIMLFQQKNEEVIAQRWALISVTPLKRLLTIFLHHFTFSIVYLTVISLIVSDLLDVSINIFTFIQWFLIAMVVHSIYLICYSLFKKLGIALSVFLIVTTVLLLFSGLIIPPAYLNEGFQLLTMIQDGFRQLFLSEDLPILLWGAIIIFVVISTILSSLFYKRGKLQ